MSPSGRSGGEFQRSELRDPVDERVRASPRLSLSQSLQGGRLSLAGLGSRNRGGVRGTLMRSGVEDLELAGQVEQ